MKYNSRSKCSSFDDAVKAFSDHEDITLSTVLAWAEQFRNDKLALKLLSNIDYFSGTIIRQMANDMVELVCEKLLLKSVKDILFVPIGNPSEGSAVVARAIMGVTGIKRSQIKTLADLERIRRRSTVRALVLLDDFSGSGDTLMEWWENIEATLRPWEDEKSVSIVLGILVINHKAMERLKNFAIVTFYCKYLGPAYDVSSNNCSRFSSSEKRNIINICKSIVGNKTIYTRGYKDCGLLVAFKHGCPNNSLPILWWPSKRTWKALFIRHAL